MSQDIPDVSDRELAQLLAAQKTLMENQSHPDETKSYVEKSELKKQYQENIEVNLEKYGIK